jgi:hypothetical protein
MAGSMGGSGQRFASWGSHLIGQWTIQNAKRLAIKFTESKLSDAVLVPDALALFLVGDQGSVAGQTFVNVLFLIPNFG